MQHSAAAASHHAEILAPAAAARPSGEMRMPQSQHDQATIAMAPGRAVTIAAAAAAAAIVAAVCPVYVHAGASPAAQTSGLAILNLVHVQLMPMPGASGSSTGGIAVAPTRPNIVLVMSDDQDGNRQRQNYADYLPWHRFLHDHGTTFVNHCADSPQCGPSRAATLSGRLPHNTGFLENGDPSGASIVGWRKLRNQTIGTWLTKAGCEYHIPYSHHDDPPKRAVRIWGLT